MSTNDPDPFGFRTTDCTTAGNGGTSGGKDPLGRRWRGFTTLSGFFFAIQQQLPW
jgi:hypothetical protein